MRKTLFIGVIIAGAFVSGYAQTMNNVEEAVRYRVPQNAVQLENSAISSPMDKMESIVVLESRSSAQIQELGSRYAFSRSGSQLDELGSRYAFSR